MVDENLKLYNIESYDNKAILQSVYSKIDTLITRAEENPTDKNINYAKEAVDRLIPERDHEQIKIFTDRISKISNK